MENSKIIRAPIRFTKEDFSHCISCIDFLEYLLNPDTDGDSLSISLGDVIYLSRLLCRECQIMREVIEASEGSDIDI